MPPQCRQGLPALRPLRWCAVATVLAGAGEGVVLLREGSGRPVPDMSFEDYVRVYKREYPPLSHERVMRLQLFESAARAVARQNARPERLWSATLNHLADRTDEELKALRGYDRLARPEASGAHRPAPGVRFLGRGSRALRLDALPESFSWQSQLQAMAEVQDQSSCGSCWAFASATALRAHAELYQQDRQFSVQQIVSCTPNPQQCGGDGGCSGATAELAMDYVARHGCALSSEWGYDATDNPMRCPGANASTEAAPPAFLQQEVTPRAPGNSLDAHLRGVEVLVSGAGSSFGMLGYRKLPENQLAPVLFALYETGPVVVSIAAGRAWNLYDRGIMDACYPDAVIDHAVVLVGYGVGQNGTETGQKYWQLQNSWGPVWGENGFIRMVRHDDKEEAEYCGIDDRPEIGSGCRGGPAQVRICGSCGILYDAVVPAFSLGPSGLWATGRLAGGRMKAVSQE